MNWVRIVISALFSILALCGLPDSAAFASHENWRKRLDFEQVSPTLFRGKEPEETDYQYLSECGINTVVNLRLSPRSARVGAERARKYGLNYVHIPVGFFIRPHKEIDTFLAIARNPEHQPVYVFCQGNRDRVGLLILAYRTRVQRQDFERAYDELMEHDFRRWLITLWRTAKEMEDGTTIAHGSSGALDSPAN